MQDCSFSSRAPELWNGLAAMIAAICTPKLGKREENAVICYQSVPLLHVSDAVYHPGRD
jgi:hypothetical protein